MNAKQILRIDSIRLFTVALAIVSTVSLTSASNSKAPFKEIVSFGDSLSDTGNLFVASGGAFPPPPYYEGRASNGKLWNEYLAEDLHSSLPLTNNYAYFGAETGYGNHNEGMLPFPLIGFGQQIDAYLERVSKKKPHPRTLFLVGVGANDFFTFLLKGGTFPIPTGIQNTLTGIEGLLIAGARHIAVLNVPDLGKTPAFAALPEAARQQVSLLCAQYNALLAASLADLEDNYRFHLVIIDAFSIINEIIAHPGDYGILNTTIPATMGADPNTSLFWDGVHPTTAAHRILADFAFDALVEHYRKSESSNSVKPFLASSGGQ